MDDKCEKSKYPFISAEILQQENEQIMNWFFPQNSESVDFNDKPFDFGKSSSDKDEFDNPTNQQDDQE